MTDQRYHEAFARDRTIQGKAYRDVVEALVEAIALRNDRRAGAVERLLQPRPHTPAPPDEAAAELPLPATKLLDAVFLILQGWVTAVESREGWLTATSFPGGPPRERWANALAQGDGAGAIVWNVANGIKHRSQWRLDGSKQDTDGEFTRGQLKRLGFSIKPGGWNLHHLSGWGWAELGMKPEEHELEPLFIKLDAWARRAWPDPQPFPPEYTC